MEFAQLGRHCAYASCHQQDYLPFHCVSCDAYYCLSHRTQQQHECSAHQHNNNDEKKEEETLEKKESQAIKQIELPPKYRCSYSKCRHCELNPLSCRNCGQNYCIKHRQPTSHSCVTLRVLGANRVLPMGVVAASPMKLVINEKGRKEWRSVERTPQEEERMMSMLLANIQPTASSASAASCAAEHKGAQANRQQTNIAALSKLLQQWA